MNSSIKVEWQDPLTFQTIAKGERVTLTTPSGISSDFIVQNISESGLLLAPPNEYKRSLSARTHLIISATLSLKNFNLAKGEEVVVTKKNNRSLKLKVDIVANGKYLILYDPKYSIPWPLKSLLKLYPLSKTLL